MSSLLRRRVHRLTLMGIVCAFILGADWILARSKRIKEFSGVTT